MKRKIILMVAVLLVVLLAGCNQIPQIKKVEDAYLATRVVQLLTAIPTSTVKSLVATPTIEQAKEAIIATPSTLVVTPTMAATATSVPATVAVATFTPIAPVATIVVPTATITALPTIASTDPGVYLGTPAWKDPFDENKGWAVDKDNFTSASIVNGVMHLVSLSTTDGWRLAPTESLGNNYIEATFTTETCTANDHFGLMFRVPVLAEADRGYLFGLTCDGRYNLRKFDGKVGEKGLMLTLIPNTVDAIIKPGSFQTNRLGIMTIDDRLILFINGVKVNEVTDQTYSVGFFGLFIGAKDTKNFAVNVDNVQYWANPKLP